MLDIKCQVLSRFILACNIMHNSCKMPFAATAWHQEARLWELLKIKCI